MLPIPTLATAARNLLSDLVCAPFAMHGPRHCATIADLRSLTEGGIAERARLLSTSADDGDGADDEDAGDDLWPWEAPLYSVANGVATVDVCGPIVKGYDPLTCWFFGLMSTDRLQSALSELTVRPDVSVVLFRFNSPGGMATGTPETAQMITTLGESKLTIGFTSDMACSAAYWLLSACRVVVATPSATVGSIGTYIALYDYSEYLAQLGVKLELFRAGNLKGIGVMGKALTDDERSFVQASVERVNAAFTGFVSAQRPDVKDSTMQGQWFDGAQGLSLGLVDSLIISEDELMPAIAAQLSRSASAAPV